MVGLMGRMPIIVANCFQGYGKDDGEYVTVPTGDMVCEFVWVELKNRCQPITSVRITSPLQI
jgi:hypothetical protein